VEIYLKIDHDRIRTVSFAVHGCINTNACANTVAQLAEGRTVAEAWGIEVEDIVAYLETLPADHTHCAELALGAFYLALSNYRQVQRHPWKRAYGR
jgi:nitrogen fixation NifU-like protein